MELNDIRTAIDANPVRRPTAYDPTPADKARVAKVLEARFNRSLTVAIYAPEPVPLSQIMADLDRGCD